jgi:hypothetical protein
LFIAAAVVVNAGCPLTRNVTDATATSSGVSTGRIHAAISAALWMRAAALGQHAGGRTASKQPNPFR